MKTVRSITAIHRRNSISTALPPPGEVPPPPGREQNIQNVFTASPSAICGVHRRRDSGDVRRKSCRSDERATGQRL